MKFWSLLAPIAIVAAPVALAQSGWQRYAQPTGLTAEFPAEPERFDKWTDIAQGRVIQLTRTMDDGDFNFAAFLFLQAVIADRPYDVDAKLKEMVDQVSGGDAVSGRTLVSQRALRPGEMPLAGMRGVETVSRLQTFGSSGNQIEYSRNMFVGNKWLSVSVRYFEGDTRWPRDKFFKSVGWKP